MVGPRLGFCISYLTAAAGCVLMLVYGDDSKYEIAFIFISQFGIQSSFNMCFVASVELIPAIFATSVFGYCNVVARLVTMMSSIVAEKAYPLPV